MILIRHGETEWNVAKRFQGHKDSDLTENGKQQVEALGTRFQDEELDQLYSSDLLRTQKTAKPVSLGTGCQVELDVRLREKNLGIFEGLNVPEIRNSILKHTKPSGREEHVTASKVEKVPLIIWSGLGISGRNSAKA